MVLGDPPAVSRQVATSLRSKIVAAIARRRCRVAARKVMQCAVVITASADTTGMCIEAPD
jgi:hypothetical protein